MKEFYERTYCKNQGGQPKSSLYRLVLRGTFGRLIATRYDLAYAFLPGGGSILDVGCGGDLTVMPLLDKYQEVYGVDISEVCVGSVNERFRDNPRIHVRVEDVNRRLGFCGATFDTILALAVLEHVFDPYHFVEECFRLLKHNGTLVLLVPNVAWLGNRLRLAMGRLPVTSSGEEGWDGGHLHYFTIGSLKRLLQNKGFKVKRVAYGGPSRRFWGSLLSMEILVVAEKSLSPMCSGPSCDGSTTS